MASADVNLTTFHCTGKADCVGGKHPDPPLDTYPLLVWGPAHPTHGDKVGTEDGKATVEAIALALAESPDFDALAARFGTTPEHARQAVDYALAAGFMAG